MIALFWGLTDGCICHALMQSPSSLDHARKAFNRTPWKMSELAILVHLVTLCSAR